VICPLSEARADGEARTGTPTRPRAGADDAAGTYGRQVRSRDPKVTVGGVLQDRRPPGTGGAVAAKTGHPAPDREAAVEMPTDDDPGAGTGGTPGLLGQLSRIPGRCLSSFLHRKVVRRIEQHLRLTMKYEGREHNARFEWTPPPTLQAVEAILKANIGKAMREIGDLDV
jgi:hypothetical protein